MQATKPIARVPGAPEPERDAGHRSGPAARHGALTRALEAARAALLTGPALTGPAPGARAP